MINYLDDFVCDQTCEEVYSYSGIPDGKMWHWDGQEIADTIDLDGWGDW